MTVPGNQTLECHRKVADAIILERAARVVWRRSRHPVPFLIRVLIRVLDKMAARLRESAGQETTG